MVETINIIPYAVYSSTYDLKTTSLYSGGENDPIINAKMHALDYLSFDKDGNRLPFDIQSSINSEDESDGAKITLTVIVFRNECDYICYKGMDVVYVYK